MIRHIVLFGFESYPSGQSKEQFLKEAKAAFEELPHHIDCLKSLKVSFNINPNESYDLMLEGVLSSADEIEIYAKHPEHVARVNQYIKPFVSKRACVDIEE